MLKLWAEGLGIPQRLFNNERVKASIEANDPHGMIRDMRRSLYENNPEQTESENLSEASSNLNNARYQLEVVMIFQQYPNETPKPSRQSRTVGWASESSMLDGM